MAKENKRFSVPARLNSFGYAFKGLVRVFSAEHNMWIHLFAAVSVITAGYYFDVSATEWVMLVIAIGSVITAELFNSATEKLVDLVSPEYNEQAGAIKDIAAGAVLICAVMSVVIGLIVFIPKIL